MKINQPTFLTISLVCIIFALCLGASFLYADNISKSIKLSANQKQITNIQSENDSISVVIQKEIYKLEIINEQYQKLNHENNEIKKLINLLTLEKKTWQQRSILDKNELRLLKKKVQSTINEFDKKRISLLTKIDSLDYTNNKLSAINNEIRYTNDSLINEQEQQLIVNNSILKKASRLKAENLKVIVKSHNGKTLKKPPFKGYNIKSISSRFNISKNSLADKRNIKAVMRIERPDGGILYDASDYGNTFTNAKNDKKFYTISEKIDFENNYEQVTLTYNSIKNLTSGEYNVFLYLDGDEIGATSFLVK